MQERQQDYSQTCWVLNVWQLFETWKYLLTIGLLMQITMLTLWVGMCKRLKSHHTGCQTDLIHWEHRHDCPHRQVYLEWRWLQPASRWEENKEYGQPARWWKPLDTKPASSRMPREEDSSWLFSRIPSIKETLTIHFRKHCCCFTTWVTWIRHWTPPF